MKGFNIEVALCNPASYSTLGQINRLRQRAQMGAAFGFTDLLSAQTSRVEISITLLAVLELIKRQELLASQTELFGPIELRANPESAEAETAVT